MAATAMIARLIDHFEIPSLEWPGSRPAAGDETIQQTREVGGIARYVRFLRLGSNVALVEIAGNSGISSSESSSTMTMTPCVMLCERDSGEAPQAIVDRRVQV